MGANAKFSAPKTATALLYGMQNAVDTNTTHSCTERLQIDLRNLPLAPSQFQKTVGAYWPRGELTSV